MHQPARVTVAILWLAMIAACAGSTNLVALRGRAEPVDLDRFMGPWHVIAYIPIHLPPLFSEKDAYNGVETYRLDSDGSIATTYKFRRGGFDGPEKRFTPRAQVVNGPVNSEWKMKFFWYLPAGDFLILDVDPAYETTIIGVPDRKFVWVMARSPSITDDAYRSLVARTAGFGYDVQKLSRVPQSW
ncbi:MAG: lipocalin family protein [Gammaproteobacteria bacterium]|nr:lipocalin family protein [Gammaproteobacteria bacterium]